MEFYRLLKQHSKVNHEPVYEYNALVEFIKSNSSEADSKSFCFKLLLGSRNHSTICLTHLCTQKVVVFLKRINKRLKYTMLSNE